MPVAFTSITAPSGGHSGGATSVMRSGEPTASKTTARIHPVLPARTGVRSYLGCIASHAAQSACKVERGPLRCRLGKHKSSDSRTCELT